jgi:dTDP-4-dehydrorhamnose reductase
MRIKGDGAAYVAEAVARRPANSRLDGTKFASVYRSSLAQWTKSVPVGVECWFDAA